MKKYFAGPLVLALSFASFALPAVAADIKPPADFSITVTEPTSKNSDWTVGKNAFVRWNYSKNPSAALVHKVNISLVNDSDPANPVVVSADNFAGFEAMISQNGGGVGGMVILRSHRIKVPDAPAGTYKIRVTTASTPQSGGNVLTYSGITTGYVTLSAAASNGGVGSGTKPTLSCAPTDSTQKTAAAGAAVGYTATAANAPEGAAVTWRAAEGQTATGTTASFSFKNPGIKPVSAKLISADGKKTLASALCKPEIRISKTGVDSSGRLSISCSPQNDAGNPITGTVAENTNVIWTSVLGSSGYSSAGLTYSWSGTNKLSGSGPSQSIAYKTAGIKSAAVTVREGDKVVAHAACKPQVKVTKSGAAAVFDAVTSYWDSFMQQR